MKRFPLICCTALLAACQANLSPKAPTPPDTAPQPAPSGELIILIQSTGDLSVDNWALKDHDIPALIKLRHPAKVLICGVPGSSYAKALQLRDELLAANAQDVSIQKAY